MISVALHYTCEIYPKTTLVRRICPTDGLATYGLAPNLYISVSVRSRIMAINYSETKKVHVWLTRESFGGKAHTHLPV